MGDILLAWICEDVTAHVKTLLQAQFYVKDVWPLIYVDHIKPLNTGTCNYAHRPSTTECIHRDTTATSPMQLEYVSAYQYALR